MDRTLRSPSADGTAVSGSSSAPNETQHAKECDAKECDAKECDAKECDAVLDAPTSNSPGAGAGSASPSETAASSDQAVPLEEQATTKIALIVGALCMALFLAALDVSIVSTALPSIAREFHASQADYNWIGSAYLLACAAAVPSWGKISDIWGRKPIIMLANVIFLVGSLLCAVSVNQRMLIASRAIQGIGSGGLISLTNICIADLFSQRARGAYYGWLGGTWAVAGAIGPLLGGVFSEYVTWRWCFYINLPLDGIALVVLFFLLDIETPKTPYLQGLAAIDWAGMVTSVGGLIVFLLGLEFGGVTFPWSSPTVICLLVFGLVLLGIFVLTQWKIAKYPMMPLRLFTSRSRALGFLASFCHAFSFIGGSYFLPLYFQAVLSATPFMAGVLQLGYIFALSITVTVIGPLIRRYGDFKTPIVAGMVLMTLGFGLLIYLPDHADYSRIIPAQLIAGFGAGPNFQALLLALQAHSRPADIATMTSAFSWSRTCSQTISIVVGGVIFQNRLAAHAMDLLHAGVPSATVDSITGGFAGANVGVIQALPAAQRVATQTAFTNSLQIMWIFYTAVIAIGFVASLFISPKKLEEKHEVRKQGLEQQERDRLQLEKERKEKRESRMSTAGGASEKV